MTERRLSRRRVLAVSLAGAAGLNFSLDIRGRAAPAMDMRKAYRAGPYGQIHVRYGEPETGAMRSPLMCVHPAPMSGRLFRRFMEAMAGDRLVFAPDMPGYGDSDAPSDMPGITDYADALWMLAESFAAAPLDLIGYGTGAAVAVALADARGERVRRLILVEPPLSADDSAGEPAPMPLSRDGSHLVDLWTRYVGSSMESWHFAEAAKQYPDAIRRPAKSWWGQEAANAYPLMDKLQTLDQPVLILDTEDQLQRNGFDARTLSRQFDSVDRPDWGWGFLDVHSADAADLFRNFLDQPD